MDRIASRLGGGKQTTGVKGPKYNNGGIIQLTMLDLNPNTE